MHSVYFIWVTASLLQVPSNSAHVNGHVPPSKVLHMKRVAADGSLVDNTKHRSSLGSDHSSGLGSEYKALQSRWAIEQVLASKMKFYLYELAPEFNKDLITCYEEYAKHSIWSDFSEEKGQNTGDLWLHAILENHTLRTYDPEKASVFFIPFYGFLSTFFSVDKSGISNSTFMAGDQFISKTLCKGAGHLTRVNNLAAFLKKQPHFVKKPERHVMAVSFWAVARKTWLDDALPHSVVTGDLYATLEKSTLLVPEPQFASMADTKEYLKWPGKLLTIPYVAKPSLVEKRPTGPYIGRKSTNFFFQGELHGQAKKPVGRRHVLGSYFKTLGDAHVVDTFKHQPADTSYESGMRDANFCLVFEGDTPSTPRLFDALAAGCIPIILSDNISLPFNSLVTWSSFSIQLPEAAFVSEAMQMLADANTSSPSALLQTATPPKSPSPESVSTTDINAHMKNTQVGTPHPHIDSPGKAGSDEFADLKLPLRSSLRDLPLHESMFASREAFEEMKLYMTDQIKDGAFHDLSLPGPIIDVKADAKSMIEQLRGMPTESLFYLQMNVIRMRDKFIFGYGPLNAMSREGGATDMILTQLGTSMDLIDSTDRISFLARMS